MTLVKELFLLMTLVKEMFLLMTLVKKLFLLHDPSQGAVPPA